MIEINVGLGILVFWNILVTLAFLVMVFSFKKLTHGIKGGNLEDVLKDILKQKKITQKNIDEIWVKLKELEKENKFHFQKVNLVKFNPFSDLGGKQSFSLVLLNGEDKGIVITGLHGRKTSRVYAKLVNIKGGNTLSMEEKRAIKEAKKKL